MHKLFVLREMTVNFSVPQCAVLVTKATIMHCTCHGLQMLLVVEENIVTPFVRPTFFGYFIHTLISSRIVGFAQRGEELLATLRTLVDGKSV